MVVRRFVKDDDIYLDRRALTPIYTYAPLCHSIINSHSFQLSLAITKLELKKSLHERKNYFHLPHDNSIFVIYSHFISEHFFVCLFGDNFNFVISNKKIDADQAN